MHVFVHWNVNDNWSCIHAQEIWRRSLRILACNRGYGEVSWAAAQWLTRNHESWFSQFNELGPFMQLERVTIRTIDSPSWKSIELTCMSNNMANMEAQLLQVLPHETLGSPHRLPLWVIWRYSWRNRLIV